MESNQHRGRARTPRPRTTEVVLGADEIPCLIQELAAQMQGVVGIEDDICLIGIVRRGDVLARRIRDLLADDQAAAIPVGSLDITLYRDDFDSLSEQPLVGQTDVPFDIDGKTVFLVDDVLFTGRTVRSALDELMSLGRPAAVRLAVLVDRGWRELPIQADLSALALETNREDEVQVLLADSDGREAVELYRTEG